MQDFGLMVITKNILRGSQYYIINLDPGKERMLYPICFIDNNVEIDDDLEEKDIILPRDIKSFRDLILKRVYFTTGKDQAKIQMKSLEQVRAVDKILNPSAVLGVVENIRYSFTDLY